MPRRTLDESKIHADIHEKINTLHADILDEVIAAIDANDFVVIGMKGNPHCKGACKLLAQKNHAFEYLEYGGYLSKWRRRNALKMWSGWPTFPMVFNKGTLIGGASDLKKLLDSGALDA